MTRVLPVITCVFVVATLVSSCARDCAPEAVYAERPSAGVDYGSGPPPSHMGNLQAHTHPGHLQVPTHTGHLPARRHMGHLPAPTHMGRIPAALEA